MERHMLLVYSDLEDLKKIIEKMGYLIGEATVCEDLPNIKIKLEMFKKVEDSNLKELKEI